MPHFNPALRWFERIFRQASASKRATTARLLRGELLEDRRLLAGVYGWMWRDVDWNAQWDESEAAQPGRMVYVDGNQNGILDGDEQSGSTDENGYFEIGGLSVGEHVVRQLIPNGWGQSWPATDDGAHTVTLATDTSWEEVYFGGYRLTGSIYGWVWEDTNADGSWDDAEVGLEGWSVYVDANGNGSPDDGESTAVTDSDGYYEFAGLLPGEYSLAQIVPDGWEPSWPGTGAQTTTITTDALWAETFFGDYEMRGGVYGWVWDDANADGTWDDGEAGLESWTVYLDANGNGSLDDGESTATDSGGYYEFAGLLPGEYSISQIVPDGWEQSWPGTGSQTATITTDALWAETDFGDYELRGGVYGWVFNDANGDGTWDDGEVGLEGWNVYLDANGNGSLEDGESSAVTDSDGYYEFAGLLPGEYSLAQIMPDGWEQSWPGTGAQTATITTDALWAETYFGDHELRGGVYGWVFDDANGDGSWDEGEVGLEGWTVYVDADENGSLDDNESSAVTNSDGYYEFAGLLPGEYSLAQVVPDGWEQSWPGTGAQTATITTDALWAETFFGDYELRGGAYGWAWYDANADGNWDDGEVGLKGWTIYVDANGNGSLDDDEVTATTDSEGYYEFAGLLPGDYLLAQVVPDGWEQSWPGTGTQTATITTDALWAETYFGNAETLVVVAEDLGRVDFARLKTLNPSLGDLWFRLETAHDGWLTFESTQAWSAEQLSLELFESSELAAPVATSSPTDARPRIDQEVKGSQIYLVRITGSVSEAELLLANLVHDLDGVVTVHGTDESDEFVFNATDSRDVTINGVGYQYEDTQVSSVYFDAGIGIDTVSFYDSSGDESLEAWSDRAVLMNSSGDTVQDFSVEATGLEVLLAYAKGGGRDSAVLHGSEGPDKLKSYEAFALLRAKDSSYTLRAKLFDSVICDSGEAGNDVAVFGGADGSEVFTYDGGEETARIQSTGREHAAKGFNSILARAEGSARDVAYFTDLPGPDDETDDVFYFRSQKTQLVGSDVEVTVRAFDEVHATASESGFDVARMYDTVGDEHLEIDGDTVRLYRRDGDELALLYEAVAFEALKAYSTDGDDTSDIGDTDMILLLYGWDD